MLKQRACRPWIILLWSVQAIRAEALHLETFFWSEETCCSLQWWSWVAAVIQGSWQQPCGPHPTWTMPLLCLRQELRSAPACWPPTSPLEEPRLMPQPCRSLLPLSPIPPSASHSLQCTLSFSSWAALPTTKGNAICLLNPLCNLVGARHGKLLAWFGIVAIFTR